MPQDMNEASRLTIQVDNRYTPAEKALTRPPEALFGRWFRDALERATPFINTANDWAQKRLTAEPVDESGKRIPPPDSLALTFGADIGFQFSITLTWNRKSAKPSPSFAEAEPSGTMEGPK